MTHSDLTLGVHKRVVDIHLEDRRTKGGVNTHTHKSLKGNEL